MCKMPCDNVVYITVDVDDEHKVYTVTREWTSCSGKEHVEASYICESVRKALRLADYIGEVYSEDYEVKFCINC